jgi:hypothetical protein
MVVGRVEMVLDIVSTHAYTVDTASPSFGPVMVVALLPKKEKKPLPTDDLLAIVDDDLIPRKLDMISLFVTSLFYQGKDH